ncbi:MAG TPA: glycosyltransferase [Chitinophagaceae bacterium]|nr:glycosyltransferase [Chitinophagaceae bacterium]
MISIIICSKDRQLKQQVEKNIAETIGISYELIIIDNNIDPKGICAVYNNGAAQAKYDILCFVHEDVLFQTNNWGQIIANHITEGADVIGIAGSKYKSKTLSGWFSVIKNLDCANFIHTAESGKLHKHISRPYRSLSNDEQVCCIDGVFMVSKKSVWQDIRFNEELLKGFHVYDIDFSLRCAQKYKLIVTYLIDLIHLSNGDYGEAWVKETFIFHEYYKNNLPQAVEGINIKSYAKKEWKIEKFWLKKLRKSKLSKEYKRLWIKKIKAWQRPIMWKRAIRLILHREKISKSS